MGRPPDAAQSLARALKRVHELYRFLFPGTPPWYAAGTVLALWLLHRAKPAAGTKRREEMHSEFRDNPHIRAGFRPTTRSLRTCLRSVFAVHNETFNIWSHAIPAVLLATKWSAHRGSALQPQILVGVALLVISAAAHTFMAHSPRACFCAFCADRGAIAAYFASISYTVGTLHARRYGRLAWRVTAAVIASLGGASALAVASGLGGRKHAVVGVLAVQMACGALPILRELALTSHPRLRRIILHHFSATVLWAGAGGVAFAAQWPECACPGAFDIGANSHNLMHAAVVISALATYRGCARWLYWYRHLRQMDPLHPDLLLDMRPA